jgi:predicted nicotinamide N-methyase
MSPSRCVRPARPRGQRASLATDGALGPVTLSQFVLSATRLSPVPFVPEILLYQADEIYALWEATERAAGGELPPPFWAVAWPGGQALARYLLDHPSAVAGRRVLDFGSGSGLVAIAAAKAGAAAVVAQETDRLAVAAIALNAAANDVPRPACISGAGSGEVVVAGDVWYEKELAESACGYLESAAAAGSYVLAGDIGRRYFPRGRYDLLVRYDLPGSLALEGSESLRASVWQVR